MRARDLGLACGTLPPGDRNSLADVPGVTVGHCTLVHDDVRTGVTAVLPHPGDPFQDKLMAAAAVLNGFGKSTGLVQVNELGTLETPVLLTNTFAVGSCANALIRRAIQANPQIGRATATVNPVVLECNDGFLNDIQAMAVTEAHAHTAIDDAAEDVRVRCGRCRHRHELLRSEGRYRHRVAAHALDGAAYHLGVLVLANFGRAGDLRLPGRPSGRGARGPAPERGSCIMVLPPTFRLNIGSSPASPAVPASGWHGAGRSGATAAATSRWPSPPPIACHRTA